MTATPTRRALAKGAAWTVPAIAIAASAPALAASDTTAVKVTGFADKCPGQSDVPGGFPKHGYRVVLTVLPVASSVVVGSVILGNGKTAAALTQPVQIGAGWEWELVIDAASSPSSLAVFGTVDGDPFECTVRAFPHCGRTS